MIVNRHKAKGRGNSPFLKIDSHVLRSKAWTNLTGWETKLLLDLMAQFNGRNNGNLCIPWTYQKLRGWHSRDTLNRALKGLLTAGWIVLTRRGWNKTPNLYGVTYWGIDECDGRVSEEVPSTKPLGYWRLGYDPRLKQIIGTDTVSKARNTTRLPCRKDARKAG